LYPLLEALAKNARPLAKIISEFAKGGLEKKIKAVVAQMKDGMKALSRIDDTARQLLKMLDVSVDKVLVSMDRIVNKADALFQQIGRQGARDALGSIDRVRTVAVRATKDVESALKKLAPASDQVKTSLGDASASFFGFAGKVLKYTTHGLIGSAGGLISLALFGKAGEVDDKLAPLDSLRDKLLNVFTDAKKAASSVDNQVTAVFSAKNITAAFASLSKSISSSMAVFGTRFSFVGKALWQGVTNPTNIKATFVALKAAAGAYAPLLALSFSRR
jgi:hypothetical protein